MLSEDSVDKLVRKKLGYPELVSAPIISEELPSISQPAEVPFSSNMIQSLMQSIKEMVAAGLNENLKHVKETISTSLDEKLSSVKEIVSATLCDDLKITLMSNFLDVMKSATQSERHHVADMGKEIIVDFADKIAEKFVQI